MANRYYVDTAQTHSYNSTASWSTSTGGSGGASVPVSGDIAIFDGAGTYGNNPCTLDTTINVAGFSVTSGYTNTITQSSTNTVTVGTSNMSFAPGTGGTFTGGSGTITFNGAATFSSGTFTGGSGIMKFVRNVTWSGTTWTATSNTTKFLATAARTITGGGVTLGTTEISCTGGSPTLNAWTLTGTLNVGALTLSAGNLNAGTSGNLIVTGNITVAAVFGQYNSAHNALITISGGNNQSITVTSGGILPTVTINKSGNTLTFASNVKTYKEFTYTAGTISDGGYTLTIGSDGNNHGNINCGSGFTFPNIEIDFQGGSPNYTTCVINGTLNVTNLTLTTGNLKHGTSGIVNVTGNVTYSAIFGQTTDYNDCMINFNGTGTQTIYPTAGGMLPCITINKSSGALVFNADIICVGHFTYTAGTITHNNHKLSLTIYYNADTTWFPPDGRPTFDGGGVQLYDLEIIGTGGSPTYDYGYIKNVFNISHILTLTGNGNLEQSTNGNIIINGSGSGIVVGTGFGQDSDRNDGLITMSGTNEQTLSVAATTIISKLIINKASDSITCSGAGTTVEIARGFTITSGTFDLAAKILTLETGCVYSCENAGTLKLLGSQAVAFNGSGGFDTNSGNILFNGTSSYTISSGFGGTFYNLQFNGVGGVWDKDTGTNCIVNGTLTITNGTFDINGKNLSVTGATSNLDKLRLKGLETVTFTGGWDSTHGTVEFDGTTSVTIPAGFSNAFYNLLFNGSGTWTLRNTTTCNNITLTTGTFATNNYGLTISGITTLSNGTYSPGSSAITAKGNWIFASALTISANTSTVTFDTNSASITCGGKSFNNVVFNQSTKVWTLQDAFIAGGTSTIITGTLYLNGNNFTATGVFSNNSRLKLIGTETVIFTAGFDTDSGTTEFNGSGSYTTPTGFGGTYFSVEFNGSGTWDKDTSSDCVIHGSLLLSASATFDLNGKNFNMDIYAFSGGNNLGTLRMKGTETVLFSEWNQGTGTVEFDGTSAGTIPSTFSGALYKLKLSGTGIISCSTATTITNDITIAAGSTLNLDGRTFSSSNTLSNLGTFSLNGSESVTFNSWDSTHGIVKFIGTSSYTIPTGFGGLFYHLTFDGVGGIWAKNTGTHCVVNGNMSIVNGTYNLNAKNLTVTGTYSCINGGILKLVGTETVSFSAFDTNSGMVEITSTGSFSIPSGFGTSFYDITFSGDGAAVTLPATGISVGNVLKMLTNGGTLKFYKNQNYNINGWNVIGTPNDIVLELADGTPGVDHTHLNVTVQTGGSSANLNVRDSDASGGILMIAGTGSINSGNNTNWQFPTSGFVGTTEPGFEFGLENALQK